jgi:hypothetical protein
LHWPVCCAGVWGTNVACSASHGLLVQTQGLVPQIRWEGGTWLEGTCALSSTLPTSQMGIASAIDLVCAHECIKVDENLCLICFNQIFCTLCRLSSEVDLGPRWHVCLLLGQRLLCQLNKVCIKNLNHDLDWFDSRSDIFIGRYFFFFFSFFLR